MNKQLTYQNYDKAINKAINNSDMEVKAKHVRLIIMGTFLEKGAEIFWRVALGFPYTNNKPVAWKFCYVLHKVLREGHSFCCGHSQNHKTDLERIGKSWYHSNEGFGKIIQMYTKLLAAKLEFHFHHPDFPCHLDVTLSELQFIAKNDTNDYFQLSVDILEYWNHVIQFQEAIFQSPHAISGNKVSKCALDPLVLSIQEASQLYNHCVRILFILHSSLPTESLQGHRIRFGEQFRRLKAVYSHAEMFHACTVPSLPEKTPNFFIEADLPSHITLEGSEFSRPSCIDFVDKTTINSSRNMLTQQITVPKSNAVVVQNLVDLSDSPPFRQGNRSRSTADCCSFPDSQPKLSETVDFLPASHQRRIENTTTQNATAPTLAQEDLIDLFDTSFPEFGQPNQSSRLSCIDFVDKKAMNSSRNMRTQRITVPKSNGVVVQNLVDLYDSPSFQQGNRSRSTTDCGFLQDSQPKLSETVDFLPASHQRRIENMTTQNATAPTLAQEDLIDPFDTSFAEFDQQSNVRSSLSSIIIHQTYIENMIAQQSKAKGNSFGSLNASLHSAPLSPISHQVQPEWRSTEENLSSPLQKPFNNSYNGCLNMQMPNSSLQRSNSIEKKFSNQFEYSGDYRPSAPSLFNTVTDQQIHVEAIVARDNHIQYLQHELERLRHENYRMESNNFEKFQEKISSLEKSLFAKENEAVQENQIKMISSPQYRSERSLSVLGNNNSKNFSENIEERQSTIGNLRTQDEQVEFSFQTTSSDSDWDDEDEIDEVQNGIENLELEDKIRDIEQQIDFHMKNKDLEVWNNNRELFNIKLEILKMNRENLIKKKQADVAEPEQKVKKGNLVNRKFRKVTSFLKDKRIKLK